jgi:hypothetical protein
MDKKSPDDIAKVVSLKAKKQLFPLGENKYLITMETMNGKAIIAYAALVICALCRSIGKVHHNNDPFDVRHCPDCYGHGYLVRFLRDDQIKSKSTT